MKTKHRFCETTNKIINWKKRFQGKWAHFIETAIDKHLGMNGDKQLSLNYILWRVACTLRCVPPRGDVGLKFLFTFCRVLWFEKLNRKQSTCLTNTKKKNKKKIGKSEMKNSLTWPWMFALTKTANVSGHGMLTYKTIELV